MSPLSKITWLVNEHPEIAHKAKKYIGIKEYIFKNSLTNILWIIH